MRTLLGLCLAGATALLVAGCSASGEGGRKVNITQADDGCTPTSIEATAGEKLNLVVKNESGKDYELEGIDGAKLEETIIPEGRTRSIGYDVPAAGGLTKLKCYVPGGPSTIIEVRAGEDGAMNQTDAGQPTGDAGEGASADSSVTVTLTEYKVEPDADSVAAGKIKFTATNSGKEIHELYVLKTKAGGYDVAGEIETIEPGEADSMTLELETGGYKLACLIVPGEAGSTVDHFKEGMQTDFEVK